MKIEYPSDILPLMDKYNIEEGFNLYKLSKGFTLLDVVIPEKAKDVIYFVLKQKQEDNRSLYRILRYRKPINDVNIDTEFEAVDMDDVAVNLFKAVSNHLM